MKTPFPGMDPYLEHPTLWTDVHNRLIAAIADAISPEVAPDYYVGLERRAYLIKPDDIVFIGRPDVSVVGDGTPLLVQSAPHANEVVTVEVPMADELGEDYLEIHEVKTGRLVTMIEVLSPTNKVSKDGRAQYLEKRTQILRTRTNLVEIDLLRDGEPMPLIGDPPRSHYQILVSCGHLRPKSQLYSFSVRQAIPTFPLPLLPHEEQPDIELNTILHDLYTRARFDLRLDYSQSLPAPPLSEEDCDWINQLTEPQ